MLAVAQLWSAYHLGAQLLELGIIAKAKVNHGGLLWKQDPGCGMWRNVEGGLAVLSEQLLWSRRVKHELEIIRSSTSVDGRGRKLRPTFLPDFSSLAPRISHAFDLRPCIERGKVKRLDIAADQRDEIGSRYLAMRYGFTKISIYSRLRSLKNATSTPTLACTIKYKIAS